MTLTPDGGVSFVFAAISITFAPSSRAAFAIAKPIFPEESFDMYLTGSIRSTVPPAVTTTFLPARGRRAILL
ncbi:hypothetical protein D3C73_1021920 [compost metagenome]